MFASDRKMLNWLLTRQICCGIFLFLGSSSAVATGQQAQEYAANFLKQASQLFNDVEQGLRNKVDDIVLQQLRIDRLRDAKNTIRHAGDCNGKLHAIARLMSYCVDHGLEQEFEFCFYQIQLTKDSELKSELVEEMECQQIVYFAAKNGFHGDYFGITAAQRTSVGVAAAESGNIVAAEKILNSLHAKGPLAFAIMLEHAEQQRYEKVQEYLEAYNPKRNWVAAVLPIVVGKSDFEQARLYAQQIPLKLESQREVLFLEFVAKHFPKLEQAKTRKCQQMLDRMVQYLVSQPFDEVSLSSRKHFCKVMLENDRLEDALAVTEKGATINDGFNALGQSPIYALTDWVASKLQVGDPQAARDLINRIQHPGLRATICFRLLWHHKLDAEDHRAFKRSVVDQGLQAGILALKNGKSYEIEQKMLVDAISNFFIYLERYQQGYDFFTRLNDDSELSEMVAGYDFVFARKLIGLGVDLPDILEKPKFDYEVAAALFNGKRWTLADAYLDRFAADESQRRLIFQELLKNSPIEACVYFFENHLLIDSRKFILSNIELTESYDKFRSLHRQYPDSLLFSKQFAIVAVSCGQIKEGLTAVKSFESENVDYLQLLSRISAGGHVLRLSECMDLLPDNSEIRDQAIMAVAVELCRQQRIDEAIDQYQALDSKGSQMHCLIDMANVLINSSDE